MSRSTFVGFNVAQRALAASQRALDVVGQNVSNVNTTGYTRQRLDLKSISPEGHSQWNSLYSTKVGYGVETLGVSQIRDPYLDIQYRDQLALTGTVDAMDAVLDDIGDIFDETDKKAIRQALNDVVSQLQNMSAPNNSGQDMSDRLVRSAMQVLLNNFHNNAASITQAKKELVNKLTGTESQKIQSYLDRIKELNISIKKAQVLGDPALELQDSRNDLIDELATYIPIEVTYEKLDLNIGMDVYSMKITMPYTDANGDRQQMTLVDGENAGKVEIGAANGMPPLTVTMTGVGAAAGVDMTNSIENGVLKGYVDMLNKAGEMAGDDVKGIGYYEQYFNSFVNTFANALNELNVPPGTAEADKKNFYLFDTSDGSTTFTAENIKISEAWMNGEVKITAGTDPDAPSANDNVLKMIEAITTQKWTITGNGGNVFEGNFFDIYDNLQNTQAIERQYTSTVLENRVASLNQISDAKDSVSGVNMDEEVMDMQRFLQSYNAASRLMTTLDEALDTLINNTGIVGR